MGAPLSPSSALSSIMSYSPGKIRGYLMAFLLVAKVTPSPPPTPPTPPPKHLKAQRAVGSQTAARCFHFSFNSPKQSVGILLSLLSDVKTGSRLIWTRSQVCKLRSLGPFHISFPEIMKFQSTVSGRWKGI